MRTTLSLTAALFLLAILHVTGLAAVSNLSHPYWHVQATLVGATIGVAMTICLFWLIDRNPGLARLVIIVMAIAFSVSLVITWVSAASLLIPPTLNGWQANSGIKATNPLWRCL